MAKSVSRPSAFSISVTEQIPLVDPISERLRIAGLRPTEARIGILRVLAASDRFLYADAIFHALGKGRSGIGLGTVYRALKLLEQQGLVLREWSEDDGKDRKAMYRCKAAGDRARCLMLICAGCGGEYQLEDIHLYEHLVRAATKQGLAFKDLPLALNFSASECPCCMPNKSALPMV